MSPIPFIYTLMELWFDGMITTGGLVNKKL